MAALLSYLEFLALFLEDGLKLMRGMKSFRVLVFILQVRKFVKAKNRQRFCHWCKSRCSFSDLGTLAVHATAIMDPVPQCIPIKPKI